MKKCILILLSFAGLTSCNKKEEVNNSIVSYPMTNGTEWIYERQSITNYYKYDSSATAIQAENVTGTLIKSDTIKSIIRKWIEKDTVINNKKLTVFKTIDSLNNSLLTEYKLFDSEGLKTYACSFKDIISPSFIKINKSNIYNLYLKVKMKNNLTSVGEIIIEDTPSLDIKYPLCENSSWTYGYIIFDELKLPSVYLSIGKKVIGTENLFLLGHTYFSYKIGWINNNLPDDYYENETNWISKEGLVKSNHVLKSLEMNYHYSVINKIVTLKKLIIK